MTAVVWGVLLFVACDRPADANFPPLNFPHFSQEEEVEIRALRGAEWVPITIDRNYLILRGSGIRIERGEYFLQILRDEQGEVRKLFLAAGQTFQHDQADLRLARAPDGSFAMVLDIAGIVEGRVPYTGSRAYVSSSGESAAVWVHLEGQNIEWRAELMGVAGPSAEPKVHPN